MFEPSELVLQRYADVLVKFALNSGKGVQKGEVVECVVPDVAKPIMKHLQRAILEVGAHPMMRMIPTGFDRQFYELANEDQLVFFPKKYLKSRVDLLDHTIAILAEDDLHELKGVDPHKIMKAAESRKKYKDWRDDKEYSGNFTWTLALYGTEAMAREAKMSLKEYWGEIVNACYLDKEDPIGSWKELYREQNRVMKRLNSLNIQRLHIVGDRIDLWISMGEKRRWIGGSGRNIPSYEIFTSPDWRGTEGKIYFDQPLYRYGNLIKDVELEFVKGRVVKARASKGLKLLKQMIARPNADKIGEYSLTDSRASRITKFMANTLFDENVGGKYGNTHLAIGMSYKDTFDGDPRGISKAEWKRMGFNDSGEHCDIISTEDRTVTAILADGREKVIYKSGKFVV